MYELQVEGMSCAHCVARVSNSVKSVDANAKVDVDLAAQKVRVESSAALDDITAVLDEAGYPVKDGAAS